MDPFLTQQWWPAAPLLYFLIRVNWPSGILSRVPQDTKTVGCAAWPKKSSDEKYYGIYVACNYYPGGNYVTNDNTWVDNVLPPRGDDVLKILCGGVPILPPNVDDPPA